MKTTFFVFCFFSLPVSALLFLRVIRVGKNDCDDDDDDDDDTPGKKKTTQGGKKVKRARELKWYGLGKRKSWGRQAPSLSLPFFSFRGLRTARSKKKGLILFCFFGTQQSFSLTESLGPLSSRLSACDGSEAGDAEEAAGAS